MFDNSPAIYRRGKSKTASVPKERLKINRAVTNGHFQRSVLGINSRQRNLEHFH